MAGNANLENFENLKFRKEVWEQGIMEAYREASIVEAITIAPASVEGKCAVFHIANHNASLKDYTGVVEADALQEPSRIELFYDKRKYWAKAIDDVVKVQMAADLMLPEVNAIGYQVKKELEDKIAEYNRKELRQESINILTEKGYSIQTAKQLADFLNYTDAESCKASIDTMDKILKSCVEVEVNNKLRATNSIAPKANSNTGSITWNDVVNNPKLMSKYKQQQKKK